LNIDDFVTLVLAEDVGRGDLYERIVAKNYYEAYIISNSNGILAGQKYVQAICDKNTIHIDFLKNDGDEISKGDILARMKGFDTDILKCERAVLNILQHASGVASNVNKYSQITDRYDVKLLDTRKTRPLLRDFEKYASGIGGATNHRFGLDDALMIKDTHRKSIKNLSLFLKVARSKIPFTTKIELECESASDAIDALCLDVDILMCDNMSASDIAKVCIRKNEIGAKIIVEASGGITLANIEEYCKSGVDAISVGSLIHQAVWLDFSMKGL
jgi:nicotinate-nucleotide pyrophosphorylase (carboxylating)